MLKRMSIILLTSSLLFSTLFGMISKWEEINKETGFFPRLVKNNFVLVTFIDGNCTECKNRILEELKKLEENETIIKEKVDLVYIDFAQSPFYQNHYEFDSKNHLYFFIGNNLKIFEDFHDLIFKPNFFEKTQDFVLSNINSVVVELKYLESVKNELEKNDIIGIYLGQNDSLNYENFYKLALKNFSFPFYSSFETELKNEIYSEFSSGKINNSDEDTFLILRSKRLINEFDRHQMVTFSGLANESALRNFFNFEKYPRLRDCSYASKNVDSIFFEKQVIIFYLSKSEEETPKSKFFENAVKQLPKKFIYAHCALTDQDSNHYLQLYIRSGVNFIPDSINFIFVSPSRNPKIEQMLEFDSQSLIEKIQEFYERNKYLFEESEQIENFLTEEL